MEYPGRKDRIWEVRVYDLSNRGMYYERGLSREEARRIAERYFDRDDVSRIVCCEEGYNEPIAQAENDDEVF